MIENKKNIFRSVFLQSPIAIELYDEWGKLIEINPAGLAMFGISSPKAVEGFNLFNDPNLTDEMKEKVKRGESIDYEIEFDFDLVKKYELYHTTKEGKMHLNCLIAPWLSNHADTIGYTVHIRDVTRRKNAELELKRIAKDLQQLNYEKDKFQSIIAHDLRSPFTGLLGYTKLLKEEFNEITNEDKYIYIEKIEKLCADTLGLLENLLEWSKLQSEKTIFEPVSFNLLVELHQIIEVARDLAELKSIKLKNNLADSIEIIADKNMLKTVVRNLLANAIKFTHSGGEIILTAEKSEVHTHLSVKDTGVGISNHDLNKLFKMNSEFKSLGTNNEKGSGIGLLLCKDIIQKHNGEIFVESELGVGTKVSFKIPNQA